jgi:tetratricopeptide (TPR) repeat protein
MPPNHTNGHPLKSSALMRSVALVTALSLAAACHLFAFQSGQTVSENPFIIEGYTQLQAGNADSALKAFQKALDTDATQIPALLGQALIYAGQQKHQQAFLSYDRIIQHHPRHVDAWNGRGLAAFNMEDFDEALNSFEKATADRPVNGFFYESLAWTRMCRGEFELAAESAKIATLMYGRMGESSIYPILLAYFAYAETNNTNAVARTLKFAQKNRPVNQWPSPVVDYLSDQIDASELLSYVMNTAQETEAHTYIGLKLRQEQQLQAAERHLNWVSLHGDPSVFEYTLARAFKMRNSVAVLVP